MLDLLVKNARCIRSDGIREENIAIENGRIAALLPCDEKPAAESVLDASVEPLPYI